MRLLTFFVALILIETYRCLPNPGGNGSGKNAMKGAKNITLSSPDGLDLNIVISKKGAVSGSVSYATNLGDNSTSAAGGSSSTGKSGGAASAASTSTTGNGAAGALSFSATKKDATASYSTSIGDQTKAGSIAATNTNNKTGKGAGKKKDSSCPNNEVWTECGNCCQRDCSTFGLKNFDCTPTCKSGCICNKGYLRNSKGVCVLPDCCENKVCPDQNEIYDACPRTEMTCANLFSGESPPSSSEPSEPKCVCQEGYFRREDGLCVLPDDCCLDPNAQPVSCPYICPGNTCANPETESCDTSTCPQFPLGCECKKGYTRISEDDPQCILIEECPPPPSC